MNVRYEGKRTKAGAAVYVIDDEGERHNLPKRLDLVRHSPTGLEWGYAGSGPAQLAVAILADHVRRRPEDLSLLLAIANADGYGVEATPEKAPTGDELAVMGHQRFKFAVVVSLPHDGWALTTDEVHDAIARLVRARQPQPQDEARRTS